MKLAHSSACLSCCIRERYTSNNVAKYMSSKNSQSDKNHRQKPQLNKKINSWDQRGKFTLTVSQNLKRSYYSCVHNVHVAFYEYFAGTKETEVINKGNFLMSALHREMTNVYIQRYCSHGNHNSASLCTYIKEYVYARKMRYGFFGKNNIDFTDFCMC